MAFGITRIRDQLLLITLVASATSAAVMFVAALWLSVHFNSNILAAEQRSFATLLAEHSRTALQHEDSVAAELQLNTLTKIDAITQVELKHADGQLLAHYQRHTAPQHYFIELLFPAITIHHSISDNNQYLGSLKITASAELIIENVKTYAMAALLALIIAIASATLLGYRLQRRLSSPIEKLHTAIRRVTNSSEDFFQLPIHDDNEIGAIYRSFNAMLTELAERNKAVDKHAQALVATLDLRNQQISEEEHKRIKWLQNLARFLQHELKNTMLGVRSSLDMIERRSDDAKVHQYIDRARNSIIFMGKLLHNVAETSGLEAELLEEDFTLIDLSATVQQWLADYRYATGIDTIALTCADHCHIEGNAMRIAQMLEKLAANAISHSEDGAPIQLTVKKQTHEAVISVANQGVSLPKERGDIFELFVSMRESAHQHSDNVGLGLYVVRAIAQAHDGYVTANDLDDGHGVIFSIHLPLRSAT